MVTHHANHLREAGPLPALTATARKAFSFPILLGMFLLLGIFRTAPVSFVEGDTWWHLTVGEQILKTWSWPISDPYSFTVLGSDWIAYEWLGEVVLALAMRLGGLQALAALLVGLGTTLVLLLYYYADLRSGNVKAAFVACLLLLPTETINFTLRPQLLGYVFFLLTLIALERFRQGRQKFLWLLPGFFLLWVNTHGSFAFGLLALGWYWVSGLVSFRRGALMAERWTREQRRQLLLVIFLCVLVLPLTPYGTRLAAYPMEMALFQPVGIANIGEWDPLSFEPVLWRFFLVLLLLSFLGHVVYPVTYRLGEIGLLLVAMYSACVHRRFVLLLVPIFAPLLAALLAQWLPSYQPAKNRYVLNVALMVLIGVGLVKLWPSRDALERTVAERFPREAVEYLRAHPVAGPMFNDYNWGAYLSRSLWPAHKVFIDGRADIYEYGGALSDYLSIVRLGPNTLSLLRKYNIQACLLERDSPLATFLSALPDWQRVYEDKLCVLFIHSSQTETRKRMSVKPAPSGTKLSTLARRSP